MANSRLVELFRELAEASLESGPLLRRALDNSTVISTYSYMKINTELRRGFVVAVVIATYRAEHVSVFFFFYYRGGNWDRIGTSVVRTQFVKHRPNDAGVGRNQVWWSQCNSAGSTEGILPFSLSLSCSSWSHFFLSAAISFFFRIGKRSSSWGTGILYWRYLIGRVREEERNTWRNDKGKSGGWVSDCQVSWIYRAVLVCMKCEDGARLASIRTARGNLSCKFH